MNKRKKYYFFSINPETGKARCNKWFVTDDEQELKSEYALYKVNMASILPGWATGWQQGAKMKMDKN